MNLLRPGLTGLLLLSLVVCSTAQTTRRFGAGIVTGLTVSQINGDKSAGYNKLGITAGLRGIARLSPRTEGSVEFLYSQRGAQAELLQNNPNVLYFRTRLDYIEIPVQWCYKDWLVEYEDEADNFYRIGFNAGLSYSRFLNASTEDDIGYVRRLVPDFIRKDDLSLLLGANVFFTRHFGLTVRYVRSLRPIYNPGDYNPAPYAESWWPHSLYFQLAYMF